MDKPGELLTAADIAAMKGKLKVHTLNPEATRVSKALGAAAGLTDLGCHLRSGRPAMLGPSAV